MNRIVATGLIAAMTVTAAQPLRAQERPDLAYAGSAGTGAVVERGAAVMASLRVPLGGAGDRRGADQRVRFDLVAGPSVRLADGSPLRQANVVNGDGIRLSFAPGHSTRVSLNGRSLVTRYASLAAAEADGAQDGDGGVSWLAITGGVLLVGLGVAYLGLEDAIDCTENGDYICE